MECLNSDELFQFDKRGSDASEDSSLACGVAPNSGNADSCDEAEQCQYRSYADTHATTRNTLTQTPNAAPSLTT